MEAPPLLSYRQELATADDRVMQEYGFDDQTNRARGGAMKVARVGETVEEERWAVANHEAGHAVMRYIVGDPCERLIVTQHEGVCAGLCVVPKRRQGRLVKRSNATNRLLIYLAGIAAELELGWSGSVREADASDDEPDADLALARSVIRLFPSIFGCDVESALQRWYEEAGCLLNQFPGAIEEIAELLMEADVLSGRVVERICWKHTGQLYSNNLEWGRTHERSAALLTALSQWPEGQRMSAAAVAKAIGMTPREFMWLVRLGRLELPTMAAARPGMPWERIPDHGARVLTGP